MLITVCSSINPICIGEGARKAQWILYGRTLKKIPVSFKYVNLFLCNKYRLVNSAAVSMNHNVRIRIYIYRHGSNDPPPPILLRSFYPLLLGLVYKPWYQPLQDIFLVQNLETQIGQTFLRGNVSSILWLFRFKVDPKN